MMYDIKAAADELMLTTNELKEIFGYYFDDATKLIAGCYTSNSDRDYQTVLKKIHALKGASMNLRMHEIANMLMELENLAKQEEQAAMSLYLPQVKNVLKLLQVEIGLFYK